MGVTDLGYRWYGRRLRRRVVAGPVPEHVAVIMDGNRRWARQMGLDNLSVGHQHGAEHLQRLLEWCADLGIIQVTVFVASIDNLTRRDVDEVSFLMHLAERVIAARLTQPTNRWRVHLAGHLDTLPDSTTIALKDAVEVTRDREYDLTVAIGYDGRVEIADAVRCLLQREAQAGTTTAELAARLTADDIAAHLYVPGLADPDLIIRTSGEQRLGGFLMWQSAYSDMCFCDVYWPGFRHIDFLRALRTHAARKTGRR